MKLIYQGNEKNIELVNEEKSILEVFRENFQCSFSSCAKNGSCGRCQVRIGSDAEKRLACLTRAENDMVVEACFQENKEIEITTKDYVNQEVKWNAESGAYFIAVDLGTTTIGMALIDSGNGQTLQTYGVMNPQRSYGTDVIARISAANEGKLLELSACVRQALADGIAYLTKEKPVSRIILAGNTTMLHLLMGQACETLGVSPFTPVTLEEQRLILPVNGQDYIIEIMPGCSAFVGADILAGLYALSFDKKEDGSVFLDLGTNGEMAVVKDGRILSTATAAGPAFEGDITANLPGTDMIELIGRLREQEIIDETGLLAEPYFENGYFVSEGVLLTQKHIRDIQLAKAAVCCGLAALLKCAGIKEEEVPCIYLAGGFGQHLSEKYAALIGLIPKSFQGKVETVGNTALAGCKRYGLNADAWKEVAEIRSRVRVENLAENDMFCEGFLQAMEL